MTRRKRRNFPSTTTENGIEEEVESSGTFKRKKMYRIMIRYVAPVMLAAILAGEVLKYFGIISI